METAIDNACMHRRLGTRLLLWGLGSVLVGIPVVLSGSAFWRGFGIQAAAWGAIDAFIALYALLRARHLSGLEPNEVREVRAALKLRRILLINGALDVLYVTAGLAVVLWARGAGGADAPGVLGAKSSVGAGGAGAGVAAGTGFGILVQGLFLLFFDFYHATALPKQPPAWYDAAL